MLNDTTYFRASEALANTVVQSVVGVDEQIRDAYGRMFLEDPSNEQLALFKDLYESVLMSFKDEQPQPIPVAIGFQVERNDRLERIKAMTLVINAMMNLDAFVVKE